MPNSFRTHFATILTLFRIWLPIGMTLVVLSPLSIPLFADAPARNTPRPNIILIMADDLGYECLGANGGTSYPTPHLDQLAAGGARFEYCYSQPLCTPTRVQLMTGIYNVRNYDHFGVLPKDQTTFGNLLRDAGYKTCIVGKWQLGHDFALPEHFGFDEHCLWQLTRRPERYRNPGLEINGKEIDYTGGEYGPDIVNDYAIDYVTRMKAEPFFLYYPMILTHSPFPPTPDSPDWNGKVATAAGGKKGRKGAKAQGDGNHFDDMVTYMDKLVGKLVTRLDTLKIRERTLVIFLGDNGTGRGLTSMMGERRVVGGKGNTDQSGMHVPLIVSMPGTIQAGQVRRDLVDTTDFLPTLCAAAGVDVSSRLEIDGRSFWPQLRGESGTPREWIYSWYAKDGGQKAAAEFARDHDYKLYRDGRFFSVAAGDLDRAPLDVEKLDDAAAASKRKLQAALDRYTVARPAKFVKQSPSKAE